MLRPIAPFSERGWHIWKSLDPWDLRMQESWWQMSADDVLVGSGCTIEVVIREVRSTFGDETTL